MIPHAWIEFQDTVTDVSLTKTEYPDVQLTGALVVLGKVLKPGQLAYTYHKTRTREALDALMDTPPLDVADSEERHAFMKSISKSPEQIRAYLKAAPNELSFRVLAAASTIS